MVDILVQPSKAELPISVTELGMEIDVKPVQPSKALHPISVTEGGITVFLQPKINAFELVWIIALQLSLES